MSLLPRIAGAGRGRGIALVAVLAFGQAAAAGLAAFATRDVFVAFRSQAPDLPIEALVAIALAGIAIALLRVGERVVAEKVGQAYAAALRLKLFDHLTKLSAREVAGRRNGALAMRFVGDLAAVRGWVSLGIARWISAAIVLPLATGVLFLLNPTLGYAAGLPILLGLVAMLLAGPRLGPAHRRLRSRRARLAADMSERIPHAPELRLLGRIKTEETLLRRRTAALVDSALERARGAALLRAIPDAVSGLAAASVLTMALRGAASPAEAAGALAAVGLIIQPLRDLAGVWDKHRAWVAAREKCVTLLSLPPLVPSVPAAGAPLDPEAAKGPQVLTFQDVTAGRLRGLDAQALPGQKIAIVGGNGAGKSTLLSLAAGLEVPEAGRVSLGGHDPSLLSSSERRRMIALVGTRSPILAGSLRRALTMGSAPQPDDAQVLDQAKAFGLEAVIERLGGLDGRIAEGGRNLSAGEGRRILLTRAALSQAWLLLLDEPDDALDVGGPALVEQLVRQRATTTVMITHSLALARRMDQLWYLEAGRIVESGPPEALLAGGGPTARFFAPRRAA
ncbi:MAG: ABC transporter ATP-binding protein [Rhodospirillales bacterium]